MSEPTTKDDPYIVKFRSLYIQRDQALDALMDYLGLELVYVPNTELDQRYLVRPVREDK